MGPLLRSSELRRALSQASLCVIAALAVTSGMPAAAQNAPPAWTTPRAAELPADVANAYNTFHIGPLWFRDATSNEAVQQLVAILKRAPFDGIPEGPQLAAAVEAAAAEARANPSGSAAQEKVLSAAWVRYVQGLKKPTPGMIYAYPMLKPQGTSAQEILLTAASAHSLADYLRTTAELNPVYGELRDAAWADAQTSGSLRPDPRLLANLDRARSIPARGRFALVDAGAQRLTMFEDGRPVDSMKIIVGTEELPTPLIASIIYYATFNPYWHAPDHLVRKTIAPTVLKQGAKYLKSHGYHVLEAWDDHPREIQASEVDWKRAAAGTVHLLVQQDPGPLNSMGNLKFPFANPEGIYLHDTPNKALFAKDERHLSNGCVRLEDARRFGRWLFGHDPVPPGSYPEIHVQLEKPVPIVVTYITAHVEDGKLTYLADPYGWDRAPLAKVMAAN